jgi:hypothetical protein
MEYFFSITALLFIAFKISSGMKRQRQILNILYANYTFQQLNGDEKNAVIAVASNILHKGGVHNARERLEGFNDLQRYGVYALAMAELEIPPAIGKYTWSYIPNPIVISEKIEKEIDVQLELFYKDHGIKLSLSSKS